VWRPPFAEDAIASYSDEHMHAALKTAGNELFASSFNIGNDQVETLGRARRGRSYLRAELD
jgi:hypothetical protein